MTNEGNFLTYCVEQYMFEKGMSGRRVMDLFSKYGVLEYIICGLQNQKTDHQARNGLDNPIPHPGKDDADQRADR